MKKIVALSAIFALFTIAASAQKAPFQHRIQKGFETHQLTRGEKFRAQKNQFHYRHTQHRALRDGRLSLMERRRLSAMKRHNNHQLFRLRHNTRKRIS